MFEQFLNEIFQGDAEVISYVARAMGYFLTGNTSEQVLLICHGEGANGKGTLLNTMVRLLGDYAQTLPGDALIQKRPGSATNDVAGIEGLRLVIANELPGSARLNEQLVKSITGGDNLRARMLYGEFREFIPQAKVVIVTNHPPELSAGDEAWFRRIHLVPFVHTVPPNRRDLNLSKKLDAEFEGTLAFAVAGSLERNRIGLAAPAAVVAATAAYRNALDVVQQFVHSECTVSAGTRVGSRELVDAYTIWCTASGEKRVSQTEFKTRLAQLGFIQKRSNKGTTYGGLELANPSPGTSPVPSSMAGVGTPTNT